MVKLALEHCSEDKTKLTSHDTKLEGELEACKDLKLKHEAEIRALEDNQGNAVIKLTNQLNKCNTEVTGLEKQHSN